MGAAREDVNVSVRGGTRIEIKGVPRIPRIPLLTYHEAMRQWNLLRLREELRRRGVTPESFRSGAEDVTRILHNTSYHPVREALDAGAVAMAVVLRGFRDLLAWPTQTNTRFSREISDRVRVVACLTKLPNIVHSDSSAETLSSPKWEAVLKAVKATADDTVVVVWGSPEDVKTGAQEIVIRAREATVGVPSETRQALKDGTNGFERILPGPDRMYPDTDSPPQPVTRERVESLQAPLPEVPWLREARYAAAAVPRPVIHFLIRRGGARLVDVVVEAGAADLHRACFFFGERLKGLRRAGVAVYDVPVSGWIDFFNLTKETPATWEARDELATWLAENPNHPIEAYARDFGFGRAPDGWREVVAELVETRKLDHPDGSADQRRRFLLGLAMADLRGRVPAIEVENAIRTAMGAAHD